MLNLFETFKANKIDDACASQVEEDKLVTLGLAYGDILNYKQTFCQMKERKLYMDRADELRRKIRLVHSGKSNTVNKPIYVRKVYTVNVGIKCMETIHRTGMKKYTLKKNAIFSIDLPRETKYDEFHNIVRSHYKIVRKSETYLGSYSGNSFQQYLNVEQMMLAQNVKKKSVQVYLFYPKSYNKLKHEEMLFHADVSDEDDRVNSQDTPSTSMTCNKHELVTTLFNTNTDIAMTNDFSSILNNSLYFEESFDRKNAFLECSCTYTDVGIRCEQNQEFEINR